MELEGGTPVGAALFVLEQGGELLDVAGFEV